MRKSLLFMVFFIFLAYTIPSDSLMEFQYKCVGTNATTTTYSYLKEPRIEETGYTRGLKSSSFNYLENGSINLEENIKYFYGNGTNITNASIDHSMKVVFNGTRGISEFFAKGFFGNNRWISAWKKIRYEESPNIKSKLWENLSSNDINVDASVVMDTNKRMNYQFKYNAEIKNGVIEAKDSTGWTNRTGAKRYDWTYESLTKGKKLEITNNLFESERIVPAAGPEGEWLPCFCSGTIPAIEQLDEGWPTFRTKKVLEADTILPSAKLEQVDATIARPYPTGISISSLSYRKAAAKNYVAIGNIGLMGKITPRSSQIPYVQSLAPQLVSFESSSCNMTALNTTGSAGKAIYPETKSLKVGIVASTSEPQLLGPLTQNNSHKIDKMNCKAGNCSDFEGVYTYDEGPNAESSISTADLEEPELTIKNIDILLEVFEPNETENVSFGDTKPKELAKHEIYKITVHNSGSVTLNDVILSAEMGKGIKFDGGARYFEEGRGVPEVTVFPERFRDNRTTTLTFKLNTMDPGEVKSLIVEAYAKKNVKNTAVSAEVKGNAPDGEELRDVQNSPTPVECEYRVKDNPTDFCNVLQIALIESGTTPEEANCVKNCPEWVKTK